MTYVELLLNTTDAFQNATKQCLIIVGLLDKKKVQRIRSTDS